MTHSIGDPNHIGVHNTLASDVQTAATNRGVDVDLPPQRNLGDTGHTDDHNLIQAALDKIAAGGQILQVARATDSTNRTTAKTSFEDAGISVTITPRRSTSAIIVIWTALVDPGSGSYIETTITDASDNSLSGAEFGTFGTTTDLTHPRHALTLIGYSTPASTSATTYKSRFRVFSSGTVRLINGTTTGQMYAIELADVVVSP